ncbi:response regulator [Daejeonella oryzae]|uniref:response regulator n=1 Tax=Daejeonella oryzae TaxID=1122943 RepID=UPI000428CE05|nr:response regulator transcription factor [Daejeonella oryzae]
MIRILIADDHSVVRKGIIQIIEEDFPFSIVQEVNTGEELVKHALTSSWDIIISDISLPGRSGIDALHQIKSAKPQLPVLILSMYPEEQYGIRVLKAGASGYLCKESASEVLVKAIHSILSGKKYITATIADAMVSKLMNDQNLMPHQLLSDREFEVMKLIAKGISLSEIGNLLSISITTVSTYRTRIFHKMHLHTNTALTLYALEHKL